MSNNQYVVYISKEGTRFYYKDGKLHRKNAPAILVVKDADKYAEVKDDVIYKEVHSFDEFKNSFGSNYINALLPTFTIDHQESRFYLNDEYYSEKEFNAIMLKEKMEKELSIAGQEKKKSKI